MIYGIILAGGKSSRMGQNKMLLPFNGEPVIFHTIKGMKPNVDHIIVVTGKYDKEIREALKGQDVEIVYNKDYELGMFSSILTGVAKVEGDFFIIPGDCPFVKAETYQKMLMGRGDIRVPRYKEQEGHPIYISYKFKDELLSRPLDYNLKSFRDEKKYEIIEVEDNNIVINLNTVLDVINFNN